MPLLLLVYLFMDKPNPLLIVALLASFAGDVLLLEMKGNRLKLGIASFLLSQLLYTIQWAIRTNWLRVTVAGLLVPAAVYLTAGILLFQYIRGVHGLAEMTLPAAVYLTAISLMSLMSFHLMLTTGGHPSVMIYTGSLLFMASDIMLARETFRSPFSHSNFLIMATYLAAQTLIILGAGLR
jgi:uncharacterized membrane protein YhhN